MILYILLIIIAIGVLLASEMGQALLSLLIKLMLIAGGLYLAFWIMVVVVGATRAAMYNGLLEAIFILVLLYLLFNAGYYLIKTFKNKINEKYPKISPFWHKHKKRIFWSVCGLMFLFELGLIIIAIIK